MNYQIVTGSTGTSISLSFIEVYGNATPAAAATGPKYQHFDNTPIQQRNLLAACKKWVSHICDYAQP